MMAFSQSIKKGQIPLNCRVCETETKITSKCIECDLLMCTKCKEKIHPKFRNAKNHRIVDIKDVGLHTVEVAPEELDFTNIPCHNHSGQISCMFCKSCDQLVCPHCISKVHNGHGLVDMKEGYNIQIEKLEAIESKVEKVLDEARYKEQSIEKVKKTENTKYQDVKKRIQDHNILLKKSVDQYTNELLKKLNQNWNDLENTTTKVKQKAITRQKDLTEKMLQIKNLKESHNTEKIFSEMENITKSLDSEYESLELKVEAMPLFIPGEIISQYNFGQLHQSPSIAKFTVSKCYTTNIKTVHHTSVNPDGSIWINNNNQQLLQKVKPVGDKLNTIASYNIDVYGIALTPSNDILLVTGGSALQMISHDSSQLVDTNYTTSPLLVVSVYVTRDNKVIVGARTKGEQFPVSGKRVVVIMDMEGKHEATYEHDRNGEPLFSYPKRFTSTRNGNIFVIDLLCEDDEGRVVILQHTGDLVNIYRGHPDINKHNKDVKPIHMACTPSDNIIVKILDSDTLHILNNTGYLIKYCNMNDVGISCSFSLAFSRSGKLYIGCSREKGSTENNAKLYEVDISGF